MRTRIGGWLLVLALLAAPGTARAQDLQQWWHTADPRLRRRPLTLPLPPSTSIGS